MMKPLIAVLISLIPAIVNAQVPFDPAKVQISELKYSGTGCPTGSVAWDLSTDKQAMTVIFDSFIAATTGLVQSTGNTIESNKRACRLSVKLDTPAGWSFTLFSVDVRGFAGLETGSMGIQQMSYKLGSGRTVNLGKLKLAGPYSDNYSRIEDITLSRLPWSQCLGRNQRLVFNTSVEVRSNPGSAGLMTIDSLDGAVVQSYGLAWKRCSSVAVNTNPQYAAQCKTDIVKKADGALVKQLISLSQASTKQQAMERANRKVKNACAALIDASNINEANMCSNEPPVCSVSQL